MSHSSTDILFITVNNHETTKLREELRMIGAIPKSFQSPTSLEPYDDYGEINGQRVMHAISMMGSGQAGGSRETTKKAIEDLKPKLLIAVGICWGASEGEQKIGDVIISQQIQINSNLKIKEESAIFRGARSEIDPTTIKLLERARLDCGLELEIHIGLMVSADTLFDDKKQRDMYRNSLSGLKGGEMEAMGIYEAVRDSNPKPNWIIVKGICDWGYNKNKRTSQKERDQAKAAQNSAKLCVATINKYKMVRADLTNNGLTQGNDQHSLAPYKKSHSETKNNSPKESNDSDSSTSKGGKFTLQFHSDPKFLTIYKEFPVVLENRDALELLKSRLLLNLPLQVSVQISDSTDYANLILENTPYQRDDMIEVAKLNVEIRRCALENHINWCLDAIKENGMLGAGVIEQCITRLCGRFSERNPNYALIDVVNSKDNNIYFKAEVPNEAIHKIASDRRLSRPLVQWAGCDLYDLPTEIVFGDILPCYAYYREIGRILPDKFSLTEWWWGES